LINLEDLPENKPISISLSFNKPKTAQPEQPKTQNIFLQKAKIIHQNPFAK
jgi:hypothetical protein